MKKLLITVILLGVPLQAASVKGKDGYLPGYWRVVSQNSDGSFDPICEHSPYAVFSMLTLVCSDRESAGGDARIDGPSGPLSGWRVGVPDGLQYRTVCSRLYADMAESVLICRE